MQPNKTKIAMIIGAMYLGVSGASFAASESFTITAETIADLSLTEETVLDFGSTIFTSAGGTCTLKADAPGDAVLQLNGTATAAAGGTYEDLTGTGCVTGSDLATAGVYKAIVNAGTDITITLNSVTQPDYTFEPQGVAGNYDNQATADGDTAVPITTAAPVTVTSPSSDDDDTNVTQGEVVFVLGGTLTLLNDLVADTIVNDGFTVKVVY